MDEGLARTVTIVECHINILDRVGKITRSKESLMIKCQAFNFDGDGEEVHC